MNKIMTNNSLKDVSRKYCPRFGQLAVEMGFITESQLKEALASQIHDELCGRGHRLLGAILFDNDWMSGAQIDQVLNALAQKMRDEEC